MLVGDSKGLDGGELSDGSIAVCQGDLDEEEKRLGLGVVVLLKISCDSLDLFRVGCRKKSC